MQQQIAMEQMVLQALAFFSLGLSQIQPAHQYLVALPVNRSQLNQVNSKITIQNALVIAFLERFWN